MIDCNVHHLVFNLQVICIASCQKTNLFVLMRRLSQLLPLKLFTDGEDSLLAVQLVFAQLFSFFAWSETTSSSQSPDLSSFPCVCPAFVPIRWGTHAVDVNSNRKRKKTTDVIHMVVIHSPAALHLSCPRSRRGVVVQIRLAFTLTVGKGQLPQSQPQPIKSPCVRFH